VPTRLWALGCVVAEVLTGQLLAGPIWHDGVEATLRREDLLSKAAGRRALPVYQTNFSKEALVAASC
jgi:hypothetical protein